MSHRIAILPENITNKIAAGEVVERPASVIKELLENSLDAGAASVTVEIEAGGRRLIRVTDNGHGMSREDALLSIERHATSKIKSDSDLSGILTLGFRGEALPSIASVSRFRVKTKEPDSIEGTEIIVEGGKLRDVKVCGMAPGTSISVEQLFFNTPARLKFMRSSETETGHVGDVVARMAISRPDVAFRLLNDGRELMWVQQGDLLRRFRQVVGKDATADLHEVNSLSEGVTVKGFISSPSVVRSTTSAMFTYVNGRFVRDKLIQHAIMQAYRGVIDRGRYPLVALFIELLPGEVDINVHPTKHEVRFRRQSIVHDAIKAALEAVLQQSPWLVHHQPEAQKTEQRQMPATYRERIAAAAQKSLELASCEIGKSGSAVEYFGYERQYKTKEPQKFEAETICEPTEQFNQKSTEPKAGYFSAMSIIGQFHGEFILCQSGAELVIIDQHAASERVAYQRLRAEYNSCRMESQRLLFAETVDISFHELATLKRFNDDLSKIGFELEPFGGTTVIISALPRIIGDSGGGAELLRDILAELSSIGTSSVFAEVIDNLLARIACHSVVRGFHPLEQLQIKELLRSMDETDFAASCPHGRPVSHTITRAEFDKIFKRI